MVSEALVRMAVALASLTCRSYWPARITTNSASYRPAPMGAIVPVTWRAEAQRRGGA